MAGQKFNPAPGASFTPPQRPSLCPVRAITAWPTLQSACPAAVDIRCKIAPISRRKISVVDQAVGGARHEDPKMKLRVAAGVSALVLAGLSLFVMAALSRAQGTAGSAAIATSGAQVAPSQGAMANGPMSQGMMGRMMRQPVVGDAAHGKRVANTDCAACHGADGNSTVAIYPKLAGQKVDYLYSQLQAFKDGTRPSPVMAAIVAPLSDADLQDVAVFFAGQARHSDPPDPRALRARGRDLFLSGSMGSMNGQMLPACAACHDPGAVGMEASGMAMMGMGMTMMRREVPNLYGQHAVYIIAQLKAFADGTRSGMPMSRIAPSVTAEQRKTIAAYLAAHP